MFGAAKSVLPVLGGMERTFDSTLRQFKMCSRSVTFISDRFVLLGGHFRCTLE